jgi:hypothetical protein
LLQLSKLKNIPFLTTLSSTYVSLGVPKIPLAILSLVLENNMEVAVGKYRKILEKKAKIIVMINRYLV